MHNLSQFPENHEECPPANLLFVEPGDIVVRRSNGSNGIQEWIKAISKMLDYAGVDFDPNTSPLSVQTIGNGVVLSDLCSGRNAKCICAKDDQIRRLLEAFFMYCNREVAMIFSPKKIPCRLIPERYLADFGRLQVVSADQHFITAASRYDNCVWIPRGAIREGSYESLPLHLGVVQQCINRLRAMMLDGVTGEIFADWRRKNS